MSVFRRAPNLLACFLLVSLVAAACGGSSETQSADTSVPADDGVSTTAVVVPDRIVVAARGSIDASPLWVADSEGFFEGADLDIDFAPVSEELDLFYSLRDGDAQVAVVSASSALRRVIFDGDELEFVAYLDGTQGGRGDARGTMSLVELGRNISSGCDLETLKVGVDSLSDLAAAAVREMVFRDGCDWRQVEFVIGDSASHLTNLTEGELDAAALLDPYTSRAIREDGRIAANLDNELCPDYGRCPIFIVVADRDWAEANPAILKRFLDTLDDAMFWIRQNSLAYRAELVSCCALNADDASEIQIPDFVGERRSLEGDLPRLLDILVSQGQVNPTNIEDELTR